MASPCLIHLSMTCILLAAKLEEPVQPSFKRMAALVYKEWEFTVDVEMLVALEARIILLLDFELLYTSPLFFLQRF